MSELLLLALLVLPIAALFLCCQCSAIARRYCCNSDADHCCCLCADVQTPQLIKSVGSLPSDRTECENTLQDLLTLHSHWMRRYGDYGDSSEKTAYTQASRLIEMLSLTFGALNELIQEGSLVSNETQAESGRLPHSWRL